MAFDGKTMTDLIPFEQIHRKDVKFDGRLTIFFLDVYPKKKKELKCLILKNQKNQNQNNASRMKEKNGTQHVCQLDYPCHHFANYGWSMFGQASRDDYLKCWFTSSLQDGID